MSNFPLWVASTSGAMGGVFLSGVINGASSTTLSLTVAKGIAGTINGVSSTTLTLTSGKNISGTINGVSSTTCTISKDVFLVGTINGVSSTTLSLTVAKRIAGVINGISSTTLALTTTKKISGIINGVSSTTLSLTVAKGISGVINGVSSTTCAISIGVVNIAGIINGVSSTVCAISINKWDAILTESSPDLSPTFGGMIIGTPANYSQFESDGTYVMNGAATVFEDIVISLSAAKVPATNAPTWSTFIGNLKAYTYSLNDFQEFSTELSHAYKEGAIIEFHIHGAVNGLDGDDRTIKFEVEYSIVDVPAETGFGDVYPSPTIVSSEITIPASTTDITSFSIDIGDDTSGTFEVGAIVKGRVRRIASSGTEPTANPFVTEVGIHIENDTIGSRTVTAK